jgi:hypothetical protein
MRRSLKFAAVALGIAAFAGPALAQFGPPPPVVPQKGPARVWNDQVWVNDKPILSADLGLGDTGGFTGILDQKGGKLCYILSSPGVDEPTMAHIHKGGEGQSGAPVLTLATPAGGSTGGCVDVKADLAKALAEKPGEYYVNVHSKAYPTGEARGALHAWDGMKEVKG